MASGGVRISLTTIGDVKWRGGNKALTALIERDLTSKVSKRDKRTMDVLHNQLRSHKGTDKIIGESASVVLEPANKYLGSLLKILAHTLASERSFSTSVTSGGAKRVSLFGRGYSSLTPASVMSEPWPRLSVGYLRKVGALSKGQGTKRWWYERRRMGSKAGQGGLSLGEWAKAGLLPLGKAVGEGKAKRDGRYVKGVGAFSKRGVPNRFTLSFDSRRRGARTHSRTSVKRGKYPVYGVTGSLVGPSKLDVAGKFSKQFNDITLHSMMSEAALSTGKVTASGAYEGLALMLVNESKRPWIAKFFAKSGKGLVTHIQNELKAAGFK